MPTTTTTTATPNAVPAAVVRGQLYADPAAALRAVTDDYQYWTGKLTDNSFQLSLAVIAANWAAFGSTGAILDNLWAKLSLAMVLAGLGIGLVGAAILGEAHRKLILYAECDIERWQREFQSTIGTDDPWPFTESIIRCALALRRARLWIPLVGGALFIIAVVVA